MFTDEFRTIVNTIFSLNSKKDLVHSIRLINWISFLIAGGFIWFILEHPLEKAFLLILICTALAFNYILFYRLLNNQYSKARNSYIAAFGAVVIITGFFLLLKPYGFQFEVLYLLVVCSAGILTGRGAAIASAFFAIILYLVSLILRNQTLIINPLYTGIQALILLVAGYWMSLVSGALHDNLLLSGRRNNYLSLLLKVGTIASQRADLNGILLRISKAIAINLPVTYCAIFLKKPPGDHLSIAGSYPLRPAAKWMRREHEKVLINSLPRLSELLNTGEHLVIGEEGLVNPDVRDLVDAFSFPETKTMGLFPLVSRGKCLGLISIIEVRNWQREPFTEEKINLLKTLSTQIGSAIDNARLLEETQKRADRLAVINEVGKAINSTIELDALLELIHNQLNRVIPTDTYYVALYDSGDDHLDIRNLDR